MKSGKIHEFNPEVYPFRLWVGMNIQAQEIKDKFLVCRLEVGASTPIKVFDVKVK